jgi:hypothetical protein
MTDDWPVIIVQDRYGRGWVAIATADDHTDILEIGADGPWGGDLEAWDFASNPPDWAAYGKTPDQALAALEAKRK